jgi:hypothetical protein
MSMSRRLPGFVLALAVATCTVSTSARPPALSPGVPERSGPRADPAQPPRSAVRHVDARLDIDGVSIPVQVDPGALRAAVRTRPGIEIRELIVKTHLDHASGTSRLIEAVRRQAGRGNATLSLPGSAGEPPRRYRLHYIALRDRQRAPSSDTVEQVAFTFQRIEATDLPGPRRAQSPPR